MISRLARWNSPAHSNSKPAVFHALVTMGADPNDQAKDGRTALHFAAKVDAMGQNG